MPALPTLTPTPLSQPNAFETSPTALTHTGSVVAQAPTAQPCLIASPPAVAACIALAGTLVGALIAGLLAYYADKRKWAREDRTRYLSDRAAAAAVFLTELQKLQLLVPGTTSASDWSAVWTARAAIELFFSTKVEVIATDLIRIMEAYLMRGGTPNWPHFTSRRDDFLGTVRDELMM